MPAPVRKSGLDISLFQLGTTDYAGDLENATVTIEVKDEDASAARDQWEYAWAVKERWQIEADVKVNSTAAMMLIAGVSKAVSYNSGGSTYTGNALVTQGVHTAGDSKLQTQRIVLKGQGALTIA